MNLEVRMIWPLTFDDVVVATCCDKIACVLQLRRYPQFTSFWMEEDLLQQMKRLTRTAQILSELESVNKMDAQVTCTGPFVIRVPKHVLS